MTPTTLSTLTKESALQAAQDAAVDYNSSGLVLIDRLGDHEQGAFSITFRAVFQNGDRAIVQLKDSPIDLGIVALARSLLGSIVPDVRSVRSPAVQHAYGMNMLPGVYCESGVGAYSFNNDVAIGRELGSILARCSFGPDSSSVVDNYIVPRLESIVTRELPPDNDPSITAVRTRIKDLTSRTNNLKRLPLALCHTDLNYANVLVDESHNPYRISAVLDWEEARLLPFGMNAYAIHFFSVSIRNMEDCPGPSAEPMAIAFWDALTANIEPERRSDVLDSMSIGFIVLGMFFDRFGETGFNDVRMKNLKNLVSRLDWLERLYRPRCVKLSVLINSSDLIPA